MISISPVRENPSFSIRDNVNPDLNAIKENDAH
jgi:hypothetical protein